MPSQHWYVENASSDQYFNSSYIQRRFIGKIGALVFIGLIVYVYIT
jgi:hypothetical protein